MTSEPKQIAVVCPGWPVVDADVQAYDDVLAINRATNWITADYTVCADSRMLSTCTPMNPKSVLVSYARSLADAGVDGLPVDPSEDCPQSLFVAIWFAVSRLGADEVDVFGARWEGMVDADGHLAERVSRTTRRWAQEKLHFVAVQERLSARGITLRRMPR